MWYHRCEVKVVSGRRTVRNDSSRLRAPRAMDWLTCDRFQWYQGLQPSYDIRRLLFLVFVFARLDRPRMREDASV